MGSTALYVDLPAGVCGYYDHETGNIYVDKRMPNRSQRCTFEHELTHKLLGHGPATSLVQRLQREIAVERLTARRLIPFSAFLSAMTKHTNAADIANALDVDEDLLYARVFSLTQEEQTIFEVCGRFCIGVGTVEAHRGAPPPIRPLRRNSLLLIA
jgi:Zn-dependent peptidase ImmA (M78 family)